MYLINLLTILILTKVTVIKANHITNNNEL